MQTTADKDIQGAAKWLERAASQDHAPAQHMLGLLKLQGYGVEQSAQQAASLFEKAAHQDYAPATFALGMMYLQGQGLPEDRDKAAHWLEKAARKGNLQAIYELGRLTKQEDEKTWQEAMQAAAQYNLGAAYTTGALGLPQALRILDNPEDLDQSCPP